MNSISLTKEQDDFLQDVLNGNNVLVDACIGSGKTTAIQALCNILPIDKSVLYLTYNRLLKLDAKYKIKNKNVTVQNYHGFAYMYTRVAPQDCIKKFLSIKPKIKHYDILVLDEYQDIDQEIADMLIYIKKKLPKIQIVAVGDMQQKIYDTTKLQVVDFIAKFLGENHVRRYFTICFRLNKSHAEMLSRIWQKTIVGVNNNCKVEYIPEDEAFTLLCNSEPHELLCLGSRVGGMANMLNRLEDEYGHKFNKHTVYASIQERDAQVNPDNSVAIFTTYDSCKGMERKTCVVFDFNITYWDLRLEKPGQSYEILRNIFCVAASRGKDRIIFVKKDDKDNDFLDEKTISTPKYDYLDVENYSISDMFDFKYREDIERCFEYLGVKEVNHDSESFELNINRTDGLIDLSPCIGIFQEAFFFKGYNIDTAIDLRLSSPYFSDEKKSLKILKSLWNKSYKMADIEEKVLFLTSLETKQERYRTQVRVPFISNEEKELISKRLSLHFKPDEEVQVRCDLPFFISQTNKNSDGNLKKPYFYAIGLADVVKNNIVYELKFVSYVDTTHFLQLACYVVALGLKKGKLINVLDNRIYEVTISKEAEFLEAVAHTVTKQRFTDYQIAVGTMAEKEITKYNATKVKCNLGNIEFLVGLK